MAQIIIAAHKRLWILHAHTY